MSRVCSVHAQCLLENCLPSGSDFLLLGIGCILILIELNENDSYAWKNETHNEGRSLLPE